MLKVLKKARKLILKGWTRQTFARDKRGKAVPYDSKKACKFCASGAINRFAKLTEFYKATAAVEEFIPVKGLYRSLPLFNDAQSSKWPVVKLFDAAIAKLEAK